MGDVLFANILAVSQNPADEGLLQTLKDNMRLHFDFEQQRFCEVPSYNCVDHPSAAKRSTGQRTGSVSTSRTRIINTKTGFLDQTLETTSLELVPSLRLILVLH